MPNEKTMRNMFENNPNGAGFMWPDENGVHIRKGFMRFDDFLSHLNNDLSGVDLVSTPIIMHFRITTHGGTKQELTHPFPISKDRAMVQSLKCRAPIGVVHNGIIPIKAMPNESDTTTYIKNELIPMYLQYPKFYKSNKALKRIKKEISSKMAFMDLNGYISTVGDFIFDKETGLEYSNSSYKEDKFKYSNWKTPSSYYGYGTNLYDDEWGYDDYGYYGGAYGNSKGYLTKRKPTLYDIDRDKISRMDKGEYFDVDSIESIFTYNITEWNNVVSSCDIQFSEEFRSLDILFKGFKLMTIYVGGADEKLYLKTDDGVDELGRDIFYTDSWQGSIITNIFESYEDMESQI